MVLVADGLVLRTIALSNGNSVAVVLVVEQITSHVLDATRPRTTSAVKVILEETLNIGPDLDSSSATSIGHGGVVDVKVLNAVSLVLVLSKGTDADAVGTIADEVLNNNIGAVGLERDIA